MVEKEEKVEQPSEEPVEATPSEAQTKTFTQEELDTVKQDGEKAYQGLQRAMARQSEELGRLRKQGTQTQSTKPITAIVAEMEKLGANTSEISAELQKQDQMRQMDEFAAGERGKFEKQILDAGLHPTDEQFDDAWESFDLTNKVDGEFGRVGRRIDRIISSSKPTQKEESKATLDVLDKAVEERARKMLEDRGDLSVEAGTPSASSTGQHYTLSEVKAMDKAEYRKNFPTYEDFTKAMQEGRVSA